MDDLAEVRSKTCLTMDRLAEYKSTQTCLITDRLAEYKSTQICLITDRLAEYKFNIYLSNYGQTR